MYTTNSLIYYIKCNNVYGTMKSDIQFDTSDYAADNVFDIPLANRKEPGLMKNKNNAIVIEFMKMQSSCRIYHVLPPPWSDILLKARILSYIILNTILNMYIIYIFLHDCR